MTDRETPLPAGRMTTGITRRGGSVFRPVGPWSRSVHEYLRHLRSAGFDGSPRVLGVRDAREELTFLEGQVGADPGWEPGLPPRLPDFVRGEEALAATGRLVRRLHEASRGFVPEHVDYRFHPHPPRPGEIVCHGDLGPWNTVYRDGMPVAFIDWDAAGPRDPMSDLAAAARAFVPLAPGVPVDAARLRLFVDAYGLADPRRILPALTAATLATTENIRAWPLDAAGLAGALEFVAGELRWLHGVLPALERALSSHD